MYVDDDYHQELRDMFDHTKTAIYFAGISNGVSKLHGTLLARYWQSFYEASQINSLTYAHNRSYWQDGAFQEHHSKNKDEALL